MKNKFEDFYIENVVRVYEDGKLEYIYRGWTIDDKICIEAYSLDEFVKKLKGFYNDEKNC